jgi:hypothetical protein
MLINQTSTSLFIIILGCIALYILVVGLIYGRKVLSVWAKPIAETAPTRLFSIQSNLSAREQLLPPLIDKPADHPIEKAGIFTEKEPEFEMLDDEENILLMEAEKVVEEIQEVVNSISTRPANPDEVFTKIRAIVSQYSFFKETEYYDAINSFVVVTVQRDCDLQLEKEDLTSLWLADAA